MRCPKEWEIYRKSEYAGADRSNGALVIPSRKMTIVFSNGLDWEHVSVSFPDRCPTWAEMDAVKRRFWEDVDTVMQLHVPVADHINCHPYCLHLWRPLKHSIPLPPEICVA